MKRLVLFIALGGVIVVSLFAVLIWRDKQRQNETLPATAPQTVAPLVEQKMYLIAVDNGGEIGELIGCNDSLVSVERWVSSEGDVKTNTVKDLLAQREQTYQSSGLYNPLWQSSLTIDTVTVQDGQAVMALHGTLQLGNHCDGLRAQSILDATLKQFQEVQSVTITINDRPLAEGLP